MEFDCMESDTERYNVLTQYFCSITEPGLRELQYDIPLAYSARDNKHMPSSFEIEAHRKDLHLDNG